MKKQFYAPYVLLALAVVGIVVAFYDAYQRRMVAVRRRHRPTDHSSF